MHHLSNCSAVRASVEDPIRPKIFCRDRGGQLRTQERLIARKATINNRNLNIVTAKSGGMPLVCVHEGDAFTTKRIGYSFICTLDDAHLALARNPINLRNRKPCLNEVLVNNFDSAARRLHTG